jgi:hypothetical protein
MDQIKSSTHCTGSKGDGSIFLHVSQFLGTYHSLRKSVVGPERLDQNLDAHCSCMLMVMLCLKPSFSFFAVLDKWGKLGFKQHYCKVFLLFEAQLFFHCCFSTNTDFPNGLWSQV